MIRSQGDQPANARTLRLWPGVVAAVILCLGLVLPAVAPGTEMVAMIGGLGAAVTILVWWAFFSRAPWFERLGAFVVMLIAMAAISRLIDVSIAGGMMGMMFPLVAMQTASLGLVVWAVAARHLPSRRRWAVLAVAMILANGVWTLARTDGLLGGRAQLAWRWTPTHEQRLLAQAGEPSVVAPRDTPPAAGTAAPAGATAPAPSNAAAVPLVPAAVERPAEWPGFRGRDRDGVVRGTRIATDWTASPPVVMWRRSIGPGWSSFAVSGDRLYTQEQRGDDEIVACYELTTGKPVWMHRDAARFWESNAGAGPRGTPTLAHGRVYSFGATGIVNALDEATGRVVWSRNAAADTGRAVPDWGFASSPLVIDDVVIVATAGTLAGYDAATGKPRWIGPVRGGGYSSPHRITIGGVTQVVLLSGAGATSLAPADGAVLWEHAWEGGAIVQPALVADGDLLINAIGMTGGVGVRRLAVARKSDGWSTDERWTSTGLKPYFNDFVVHKGHAFGFDGSILSSIDLSDGKRTWKGGRYGDGQLVLLADQDLLLVLSEEGELALVRAKPDAFTELARLPAIEGKTWNHPVVVGDVLLVRNGQEMAAFRLGQR